MAQTVRAYVLALGHYQIQGKKYMNKLDKMEKNAPCFHSISSAAFIPSPRAESGSPLPCRHSHFYCDLLGPRDLCHDSASFLLPFFATLILFSRVYLLGVIQSLAILGLSTVFVHIFYWVE